MTDTAAASQGITDNANPAILLREVLETRITRIEEEIALVERQTGQLQTRMVECQERLDSAENIRQLMLRSLAQYGPEEVVSTLDEHGTSLAELALVEQRFEEFAERRAEAKERLKGARQDLELLTDAFAGVGPTVSDAGGAGGGSMAFRNASRQVFQIIEEERMRIARDMHDGPAQSMSNLVLQAEILERLVNKPEAILAELQDFKNSVRNALDETRQLIFDLRPMTLDDLGLVPTLRKYTKEYGEKYGIMVRLNAIGEDRRLPSSIEGTLFRIIQEALTNVQKHAHARTVEVALNFSREKALASIKDDGAGFDVRSVEASLAENRNLGLISMRERCELEHGILEIKSQPGKGTEIRMEFQLE